MGNRSGFRSQGQAFGRYATLDTESRYGLGSSMNDQEVIMNHSLPTVGLTAHSTALKAAGIAISLVRRVPSPLKSMADQVVRAASSVPANLAEGHGRFGKDRFYHWRIAYGSAKEVDTFLRLLLEAGAIEGPRTIIALDLFDEVRAMTWRLIHPTE